MLWHFSLKSEPVRRAICPMYCRKFLTKYKVQLWPWTTPSMETVQQSSAYNSKCNESARNVGNVGNFWKRMSCCFDFLMILNRSQGWLRLRRFWLLERNGSPLGSVLRWGTVSMPIKQKQRTEKEIAKHSYDVESCWANNWMSGSWEWVKMTWILSSYRVEVKPIY